MDCEITHQGGARYSGHCFTILIPNAKVFTKVSISVPCDVIGNRELTNNDTGGSTYPTVAETALFNAKKIVYLEHLGYSDVCRFFDDSRAASDENVLRLKEEILRLEAVREKQVKSARKTTKVGKKEKN